MEKVEHMKTLPLNDPSVKVFGIPEFYKTGKLERLPESLRKILPSLDKLGRRTGSGRIGFRTDSKTVNVTIEFETLGFDIGMGVYSCQSADIIIGDRTKALLSGFICPRNYENKRFGGSFTKSDEMQDVTIFLPRNEILKEVFIEVEDDADVEPPTPYKYDKPVVYYGSSITEGGHTQRLTNAYPTIISRRLDTDFINFGFSGAAKGEIEMAEHIASLEKSVLVMDYDHNSPNPEHLKATHEPFFKCIRALNPDLPVVFISRPDYDYCPEESEKRRLIIRKTYENAVAAGDGNVWFIDGRTLFGDVDRDMCVGDRIHPNDLGHYRMANVIEPVIRSILEKQ